jgi:hypothetical protein
VRPSQRSSPAWPLPLLREASSTLPSNERKRSPTKKIVEKGVPFFVVEKRAAFCPRLPRDSPQSHHKFTTTIHHGFQNTLQNPNKNHKNDPLPPQAFFRKNDTN